MVSASEAARRLGTSTPRIVRAVARLGLEARQSNGRYSVTPYHLARLRAELGVAPSVRGLTRIEAKILAGLARAPLGLRSVRAVAARSGVSPSAASRALRSLIVRDLVRTQKLRIAAGRVREVTMWHANRLHPLWTQVSGQVASAVDAARPEPRAARVPECLGHLFWNTADTQLNVAHGGPYIARRLLRTMDLEGLAWGAANLTAADWREAARARGLEPSVKVLAENLAAASEA